MYVSKSHPDYERLTAPSRPATPPEPTGEVLARFPRKNVGGPAQELRVVLDSFEGHPYISLRLWERDQAGQWWPTRKGLSVRMGEAEDVAEALGRAAEVASSGRVSRALEKVRRIDELRARAAVQGDAGRPGGPTDEPRPPKRQRGRQGPSTDGAILTRRDKHSRPKVGGKS